MLQTVYEGEMRISPDWRQKVLDDDGVSRELNGSGVSTAAGGAAVQSGMRCWERESDDWEWQLQKELALIQRQQHIQKQLLISEFHKQHQNLLRQHQAQLQEHVKALLALRQQQEVLSESHRLEVEEEPGQEEHEHVEEQEHQMNEQPPLLTNRKNERSRESATASTEVRQKLHDFLLSKLAKDPSVGSPGQPLPHPSKIWATQHMSMEQSSPPLGETPPTFKSPLPSSPETRGDFPLRKTASEPNLKVRSRLKQKVSERRSGPIQRRRDGSVLVAPHRIRGLEPSDTSANDSTPGSGSSSPIGFCSTENVTSHRPSAIHLEPRLLKSEGSLALLTLYSSPSLPNLTLGLQSAASPPTAATALKERPGKPTPRQSLGAVPPVSLETKVNNSQQALLQHILMKDHMRQQKMLPPGNSAVPALPVSPLVLKDRSTSSSRPRLPRQHRPLNRTQSAPLPHSTLAHLVLQQQHHSFVEKQKQLHQQVHLSQILRQPSTHLTEDDDKATMGDVLPPGGVIRHHGLSSTGGGNRGHTLIETQFTGIKVKEEHLSDSDAEMEEGGRRKDGENCRLLTEMKSEAEEGGAMTED
ncbi:histone deacetylase 9-B-like isoform X2 [Denticeps clupeoides]|uniref:histone deacetylase 9-B-like isoform X2 n=1 Tax=Denticeps clupeoides TaxID=299321 RepID=UPI0010A57527|nr:histone deacetylase 9-B-like isoform X2 [Denticeps clupeoides]